MRENKGKMAEEYTLSNEYSPVKEQIEIGTDYAPAIGEYTAPEKEFSDTIKEFEYSAEEETTEKDNKDAKKMKKLLQKMSYLVASTVAVIVIGQAANTDSSLPPIYGPDTEINGGTSSEDDMGYGNDFYERREFEDALAEFIYAPQERPYYIRDMYSIDGVKAFVEKKGIEAGETYTISGVNVYYSEEPRQYADGRVEEGATLTFSVPRVNDRKSSYTSLEYTGTVLTKVTTHILYSDERMQSEIENLGGFGYYLYYNDHNYGDLTVKDVLYSLGDDLDIDLVLAVDKEEAYVKKEIDTNRFGVVTICVESEKAMYGELYSKSITISFEEGSASPYESIYITEGFPANYLGEIKSLWINAYPWENQPAVPDEPGQDSEGVVGNDKDILDQNLNGSIFRILGYGPFSAEGGILTKEGTSDIYTYLGEQILLNDTNGVRSSYIWEGYVYAPSSDGFVIINSDGEVAWSENEAISRIADEGENCKLSIRGLSNDTLCYIYTLEKPQSRTTEVAVEMVNLKNGVKFLHWEFPNGIFNSSAFYDGKIVIIEEAPPEYPIEEKGSSGYPFMVLHENGEVTSLGEVGQWMEVKDELPTEYILMKDYTTMMTGNADDAELVLVDLRTGEKKYRLNSDAIAASMQEDVKVSFGGQYKVSVYFTAVHETYTLMHVNNYDTKEKKSYLIDFRDVNENGVPTKYSVGYDAIDLDDTIYLRVRDGENYYFIARDGQSGSGPYKAASKFTQEGYAAVSNEDGVVQIVDKDFNVVDTIYNATISTVYDNQSEDIIFLHSTIDGNYTYMYYFGEKYK